MANINTFVGKYKNLARMNRFRMGGFNKAGISPDLEFFAKGSMLPATNLGILDVPYQGRILKLDGDRTYEDFTFTVMDNEKMELRKQFEDWSNEYNSPVENVGEFEYRDGWVELLGRDGEAQIRFDIKEAVCYVVGQVDLGWDQNDQVLEYQVTIGYNYHEIS